jgi:hypothetical protein
MTTSAIEFYGRVRYRSTSADTATSRDADGEARELQLTRELVQEAYDPDFSGTTVDLRRGLHLADRIYALDEPWRSRFVALIVQRVGERATEELDATPRIQMAIWLADQGLARVIRQMLRTWTHEG